MDEEVVFYYFEDPEACGCPEAFKETKHPWEALSKKSEFLLKPGISGNVHRTAILEGDVKIGKNTIVGPYAVIEGPAMIGDGCVIRSNALIRPGTFIGNNVAIGHSAEVKNSIVFDDAKIASFVFAGDSIIGKGARLGSGTILGNRRFDQAAIEIKVAGKSYPSGTDKFGAIIGDYARLGAGVVTAPGTLVGKFSWIAGNCSLKGFIPKQKFVNVRQEIEIRDKERTELRGRDMKGNI